MMFSTYDRDNDAWGNGSCTDLAGGGGWWFAACATSNLNGRYYPEGVAPSGGGIHWYRFLTAETWNQSSLVYTRMQLRPKDFSKKVKLL